MKEKQERSKLAKFLERKISTEKVETSGIAALTFGDLIYDMVRVDQRYIKGVDFSSPKKDLSSVFKIGKENISASPETLNVLHERNYAGYTHEFVTHQWARNRGEEVEIPKKFNQPGYDSINNGEKFQIKFNSVDAIREHRLKYPDIKVQMVGRDGNAFSIIGRVTKALRNARVPLEERKKFQAEATKTDYNNVLQTVMRWVNTY